MKYIIKIPFVLLSGLLLVFGSMNLIGVEQMRQVLHSLNYPDWFMYLMGLGEIVMAVALWFPKTRIIAILFFWGIFSGAVGSHVAHGDGAEGIFPPILFLALTLLCFVFTLIEQKHLTSSLVSKVNPVVSG